LSFEPFFAAVEEARSGKLLDASDLAGTALGLKLDGLLRRDGARWIAVVPLSGVDNPDEVRAAVQRARVPAVEFIDLQAISREMMRAFRANALRAFAGGALLIFAVLAVGLRGVRPAARVALPVAAGVIATAAALCGLGQPLSVFHLVALMLVAGIGTNYALFLARAAAIAQPHRAIVRSLAVVAGTTLCAFGTLATSQTPVLHAIGLAVTLGVVLTLAFSVLLIPYRPPPARVA
jgi:predicted exporter